MRSLKRGSSHLTSDPNLGSEQRAQLGAFFPPGTPNCCSGIYRERGFGPCETTERGFHSTQSPSHPVSDWSYIESLRHARRFTIHSTRLWPSSGEAPSQRIFEKWILRNAGTTIFVEHHARNPTISSVRCAVRAFPAPTLRRMAAPRPLRPSKTTSQPRILRFLMQRSRKRKKQRPFGCSGRLR
jgi:hypothetical protein